LDIDPYADPAYLIAEYVDGPTVRQLIDEHGAGLPIDAAVMILYGTLSALAAAHEAGVIHRDVKPSNILIANGSALTDLDPARVKVTDFGLRHLDESQRDAMMQSGSIVAPAHRQVAGTLVYMSPEQRSGDELDARSDLYSTGVELHEMLTGLLPQGTDLPSSIRQEVPGWLDGLFERSYTRRDHRFASADEMRHVIDRYSTALRKWREPAPDRPDNARVRCPGCGSSVKATYHYCIHCGRRLADQVPRCPSCRGFVGPTDSFCILCGTDLRERT
jgi:serine/threonine-protein kinase